MLVLSIEVISFCDCTDLVNSNNKIVIAWSDDFHNDAGGGGGYGRAIVGTVDPSDKSITFGFFIAMTSFF